MTPAQLHERLQQLCPKPLDLRLHESKSTFATARHNGSSLSLSLHKLFLHSPTPVLQALIRFALKPDAASRSVIRQMAHLYFTTIAPQESSACQRCPKGQHVDLQQLYDKVNRESFNGALCLSIGWGKTVKKTRFCHITFGSFDRTEQQITINPRLDSPDVPIEFTEFVVYHEMLHAVCLPVLDSRGRMCVHTKEFREKEALHPYYEFAKEWERHSLQWFRKRQKYGRP